MYRINQDDNSLYTQEELSCSGADEERQVFLLCVSHDKGVRLCVEDIKQLFDDDFGEWLKVHHSENEPEFIYADDENPDFEVITVFDAIDMVYSLDNPDKALLCRMLDSIETRLVRIW